MSYGTSDSTSTPSTKTEARNLNAIDASAAQRDDSSPAPFPTTTPKNREFLLFIIIDPKLKVFYGPSDSTVI